MKALRGFIESAGDPFLLLHDTASAGVADTLADLATRHLLGEPLPESRRWAGVAVVVADRGTLRAAVADLGQLGRSRSVACVLTDEETPVVPALRPDWAPLAQLGARSLPAGGVLTTLRATGPLPVHAVLAELARAAGSSRPGPGRHVVEGPGLRRPHTLPPDVAVRADPAVPVQEYDATVTAGPSVVTDPWLALGPLDEGVLNPIAWETDPDAGEATLDRPMTLDRRTVEALRALRRVRVDWGDPTPELARTVAGLAMTGTPLVGAPPAGVRPWLGDPLADALVDPGDLDDLLRREEHSVRVRRAAHLTQSGPGWRHRVTIAAGRRSERFPSVSVVMATRRPEQLDHAVAQVARQRGLGALELVVAGHGFQPDLQRLREAAHGVEVQAVSVDADALFGDVLDAGVAASSGRLVVKMDDDDFYGPDFLLDLLLARDYSGADVVGTTAEFVYLEDQDRTVRRHGTPRDASERYAQIVAGGTISITRELLDSVGGFAPVRRFVDHQLFHAVRSVGGTVYRAHGLGFVLRRTAGGHTWTVGDDHFLDPARLHQQWEGFAPSRILGTDTTEAP